MPIPLQQLYEEFNRRIDKPHEFNRLLSSIIAELAAGSPFIVQQGGMFYMLDNYRGEYLSLARPIITAGFYGNNVTNRYLRQDEVTMAGGSGFTIPRDATITAAWGKSRNTGGWNAEIRKNGIPITLVSIPIVSGIGYDDTVNIPLDAGDYIEFYLSGTGVEHPLVACELAWRITP